MPGDPPICGSITPTGDNSLVREEAYEAQLESILVITPFRLRGPSKDNQGNSFQPDIVLWNGNSFVVRTLKDWTSYGAGQVEAECISVDLVQLAPGEAPPANQLGNIIYIPAVIH